MKSVNIHEAKSSLSKLIADVESKGVTIVLCRAGKPVANLVPAQKKPHNPLLQHPFLKRGKILYNPIEPLTKTEWPRRYR